MTLLPDDIKNEFEQQGVSIAAWARERAFDARLVYAVLAGKNKASRGKSHLIAVALGMKPGAPVTERTLQLGLAPNAGGASLGAASLNIEGKT